MRINRGYRFTSSACALAVASTLASAPVAAFEFGGTDFRGSFDTTVSLGGSWRLQDRDPELIGITNGGVSRSVNDDDGNLNYEKKDTISAAVKATHDIALDYKNYGAFVRGTYFYDHAAANKKDEFGPQAEDRLIFDADLLDAYVHGAFDIVGRNLNLRLGRQVVSWGESTFILNGINVINAVDVRKFRVPGAELKEALVASPMVWASQEITRTTSIEGFVLTRWDKTEIDPRASYFSTNDVLSEDGDKLYVGSGRRNDQHNPPGTFIPGAAQTASVWAPRAADRDPGDDGQYGFAVRQFVPTLNSTEFALYYLNYHSRTPFLSGVRGGATVDASAGLGGCLTPNFGFLATGGAIGVLCTAPAVYFGDYPEDIRMTGFSFNTMGPAGIAFQGEFSYRPNQPVQLAPIEVILAAGGLANNVTGGTVAAASVPIGTEITGYRRVKVNQAQMTATKAFGPTLGADQLVVLGEAGFTYMDLPDNLLFAGPAVNLPAVGSSTLTTSGSTQPGMEGYATKNSWGYRLLARWDFESAIGAATLSPRIAYAHDVHGVSPTFNQGAKAVTVGLTYNLRQVWTADISYTGFWGGRTYAGTDPGAVPPGQSPTYASSANPNKDRDFLSVSLSYAF